MRDTHIILVAFEVEGDTRRKANDALQARLAPLLKSRDAASPIECWWIAEDDRTDGSDLDSAVFVKPGAQRTASLVLFNAGLTGEWNIITRTGGQFSSDDFDPNA